MYSVILLSALFWRDCDRKEPMCIGDMCLGVCGLKMSIVCVSRFVKVLWMDLLALLFVI